MDLNTPADVNAKIRQLRAASHRIMAELEPLCEREAVLQSRVEQAGIVVFLSASGTVEQRKNLARQAEYDAGREEWLKVKARGRFLWRKLAHLDADLDAVRSIGRNIRAELETLGADP